MTSENAAEKQGDAPEETAGETPAGASGEGGQSGADDADLDQAIGELRGVLKKDAEGVGEDGQSDGRGGMSARAASEKAFADFGEAEEPAAEDGAVRPGGRERHMGRIMDIPVDVEVVLGTSRMPVSALMNLKEGSTIPLDRKIGAPVEITVNGRVLGRGEITVLDEDESRFGIRLIDLDTETQ